PGARDASSSPASSLAYRLPVYGWLPVQFALLLWGAREAAVGRAASSASTFGGLALSLGIVGAGGINAAHELLHRAGRGERCAAAALLASVAYGHFAVEHAVGHHGRVGTAADPATARLGEPFYAFLPRSVGGGFRSAWAIARRRRRRSGRGGRPRAAHGVAASLVASAALAAALGGAWGARAVALWAAQAAVAVVILEKVNYMEHYGLRVGAHHSWEAPQTLTNVLLFKLQRHADHHQHAGRRYQTLRASPASPVLPAGYPTMALLCMVPP
ncbi:hypothetical protein BU14_2987s0001, partial [Porphyra umbilicalis]